MTIEKLISHAIPVLSPADTVSAALEILEDNNIGGLPVVTDDEYEGLVTEENLLEVKDAANFLL